MAFRLGIALLLLLFVGCESQQARLAEHRQKGDAYPTCPKGAGARLGVKDAVAVEPNSAAAHYGLALTYLGSKDPRRAFWELEETVRLDPKNVEARLRQGEFLLFGKKEELQRAVESADAILAVDPKR